MLKDKQNIYIKIHVLIDGCMIILSYLLSYYLRFYVFNNLFDYFKIVNGERFYSLDVYSGQLIHLVPLYLFIYFFLDMYSPMPHNRRLAEAFRMILANIVGIIIFITSLYFMNEYVFSRKFLFCFFVTNLVLGFGSKALYSYWLRAKDKNN